ncbi:MAG TPA: tetratricopeptide repeat protein [Candidatus Angelobacter sp.]|jgi:tetratricopeptide (TPR) repeat protein|nr:tetratricopeptide repeat protein [Candidatus Angelobacter sp.]
MTSCFLILFALLLPMQRWNANVTGRILDRESKPMAGAQVTYTNVGTIERNSTRIIEGSGKVYKVKTDKDGRFSIIGVAFGVYEIEVKAADGSHVYSGKKNISDPNNKELEAQNDLQVDLSTVESNMVTPGGETNLAGGKKTKEQLELIRQENANAAKINRLIIAFHGAMESQDWPNATKVMEELISLDANRWEFYQNLGTIQANQRHYEEAIQSFAKGAQVAEKLLPTAADPIQAKASISDLYLSEGDCYNRLGKLDEAQALYEKAAAANPHPAIAHFRECNALTNNNKIEAAIEKCNQSIAEDPTQWEPYQVLGGALNTANKPKDALEVYEKGVAAAKKALAEKPDSPQAKAGLGQMLNSEGNLLAQQKKYDEAIGIFNQAAEVAAYPAMPYFNVCAIYYNLKRATDAIAACERAITSDPTLSDAYYIKATVLFGQGHAENGKYVVPPGTTESLNKYLEYAPFGQHASAVRDMIDKLNEEIEPAYKPANKTVKK